MWICNVLAVIVLINHAFANVPIEEKKPKVKRLSAELTEAIVGAAIDAGASLAGTTVGALKQNQYSVAVSGAISNLAKWNLRLDQCTVESGYMNTPMRSVASGVREGFAGHKTSDTAKGSWIICTFKMNKALVHFMYSAPYNFNFDVNTLAVAICSPTDWRCNSMTASNMYYNGYSFLAKAVCYYKVRPLKICNLGLCITGVMGTSHKPEIDFKVYPTDFENLSSAVQSDAAKERWDKEDYEEFIRRNILEI